MSLSLLISQNQGPSSETPSASPAPPSPPARASCRSRRRPPAATVSRLFIKSDFERSAKALCLEGRMWHTYKSLQIIYKKLSFEIFGKDSRKTFETHVRASRLSQKCSSCDDIFAAKRSFGSRLSNTLSNKVSGLFNTPVSRRTSKLHTFEWRRQRTFSSISVSVGSARKTAAHAASSAARHRAPSSRSPA